MKKLLSLVIIALVIVSCQKNDNTSSVETEIEKSFPAFDSVAAAKYGADAYGMKTYVMAFLKRGTNDSISSEEAAKLQNAHLKNIRRMADEGKLVLAGPFMDSGDLRGIYIFDVETIEEAEALTNTDPSIQAGVLAMDLKQWYGSAALMAVNDLHNTLAEQSFAE